jgi:ParB family chromosome partitioning protein
MKVSDRFKADLGGNIAESMGATSAAGSSGPLPGVARGVPGRYDGVSRPREALTIPTAKLRPDPDQPRKEFDPEELAMLAESLKSRGQLQPIRARWDAGADEGRGAWTIVSGERRWRAAGLAGIDSLMVVEAKGEPNADDILEDQLVENAVRSDLRPIEQAHAYRALMDRRGYSGRQLAERLAISHMSVQRALALLDLPAVVQEQVEQGGLSPATAFEVGKLEDPAEQVELAQAVAEQKLTRSEVAEAVKSIRAKRPAPAAKPAPVEFDLGDGILVRITWRKANATGPTQALRRALKASQDRERAGEADAA